jgi:hypothetical protein
MTRTDEELIEVLESMGTSWHHHFVMGSLVGFRDESGKEFVHVIEDDELNQMACRFLERNGKIQGVNH